jgi:hypothetical protein
MNGAPGKHSGAWKFLEPFDGLLRKDRDETKPGKCVPLDTRVDCSGGWTLPFSPIAVGCLCSTASRSALVPGADLCSCHRAHWTKQSVGVWCWGHHTDSLELPQFVRNPSLPGRCGAVLVSCARGPCEPARDADGDGWRRGPFSSHHRLHGRVYSAAASLEAMGAVLCRRLSSSSVFRSDYRHNSSALVVVVSEVALADGHPAQDVAGSGMRCFQRDQPSVIPAAERRMAAAPTSCKSCRRCPKAYRSTKIATIG